MKAFLPGAFSCSYNIVLITGACKKEKLSSKQSTIPSGQDHLTAFFTHDQSLNFYLSFENNDHINTRYYCN